MSPKKSTSTEKATNSKEAAAAASSTAPNNKTTTKKAARAKKSASSKGAGTKGPAASRAAAPTAVASKFWAAAKKRAQTLTNDPEKLQKIAAESYESAAARSAPFDAVMDDFRTLVRLVVAFARGNYREIPTDSLVTIVAGLLYVVSPVDLIPDMLPGGFVDDAAVIIWVVKSVRSELDAFRAWELGAARP